MVSLDLNKLIIFRDMPTGGREMILISKHNQKKVETRFRGNYVLPSNEAIRGRIHAIKTDLNKYVLVNNIEMTNIFLAGKFYTLGLCDIQIHSEFTLGLLKLKRKSFIVLKCRNSKSAPQN